MFGVGCAGVDLVCRVQRLNRRQNSWETSGRPLETQVQWKTLDCPWKTSGRLKSGVSLPEGRMSWRVKSNDPLVEEGASPI